MRTRNFNNPLIASFFFSCEPRSIKASEPTEPIQRGNGILEPKHTSIQPRCSERRLLRNEMYDYDPREERADEPSRLRTDIHEYLKAGRPTI